MPRNEKRRSAGSPAPSLGRRNFLQAALAAGGLSAAGVTAAGVSAAGVTAAQSPAGEGKAPAAEGKAPGEGEAPAELRGPSAPPVRYCLNTSTIRGQKLPLARQVELAAQAGYDAIEPWMRDIHQHAAEVGPLQDLGKRIADLGLTVESAIGFANWIVDDPQQRAKGLETARIDMRALQLMGGRRIAAPPVGATRTPGLDLDAAAQRYADLLRVGRQFNVTPQLELWGFSANLRRLGELLHVAVESGQPDACLLPDVYHIYKGGSDFAGLRWINARKIHVFHMNDYPDIARDQIKDADRVYPGRGVAPLGTILRDLRQAGFAGTLSLELFNPEYWKQDPLQVCRTGLESMKQAVAQAERPAP